MSAEKGTAFDVNAVKFKAATVESLEQRTHLSTVPAGFVDAKITGGIAQGTSMALAPDGRIFVAQQGGKLRVVKDNALLSAPFVTVSTATNASEGLIGVTIDPAFSSNKYLYVSYTKTSPLRTVVSRFTTDGDVAAVGSEKVLFSTAPLQNHEHNGGALAFGPDGKLYIALGDDFTITNSQSLNSTQGKILRINSDGTIPTDNPFYTTTTNNNRAIWALGLRNPFTIAFQPGTGRLFAGDVGSDFWEELNDIKKGANYGWSNDEGPGVKPGETAPLFAYRHGELGECIIGGPFYNPSTANFPANYVGKFFMSDYTRGWIKTLDFSTSTPVVGDFISGLDRCVSMTLGSDGSLYYLLRGGAAGTGEVHRVSYTLASKPMIVEQPSSQTVALGQSATFEIAAAGTNPLKYQWRRSGEDINGATNASYTLPSATAADDNVTFDCVVTNTSGSVISASAKLVVLNDHPPVPHITLPDTDVLYRAGETIQFAGGATDEEDGELSADAFTWTVLFHHDTHSHPFLGPVSGITNGSFDLPQAEETSSNVYYQLLLTVTDSQGVSTTVEQDLLPRKVNFAVQPSVAGLSIGVDAVRSSTPRTIEGVVGIRRQLSAPAVQVLDGSVYQFVSWSDLGDRTHYIFTPETDTTYTANYAKIGTVPVGNGINASYFDNADFTGTKKSRVDPNINFIWSLDPPISGFGKDNYSVRWTGFIVVPTSEKYTFYANSDDGIKVWIDNKVVIDKFNATGRREYSGSTSSVLQAGKKYAIKVEYKELSGFSQAQLSFGSGLLDRQIVPQAMLFTSGDQPPPPPPAIIVNASADTYVRSGPDAGKHFGSDPDFRVKADINPLYTREAFLRFDLTGVTSITSALLSLTGKLNASGLVNVGVYASTATPNWDESTLTYNTRFIADPSALNSFGVNSTSDKSYSVDLTTYLRNELALGHRKVTFILKGTGVSSPFATFHSREAATGQPQLRIS